MDCIYILHGLIFPTVKGKTFNIRWVNYGYFSSFEKAEEQLKEYAECEAEEEAEEGIDPQNVNEGYLIEQCQIDNSHVESNSWLYDHEGNLIDTERFPWEIGKPFRGRPAKHIRLKPGDIVGVLKPGNPRVKLGVVVEPPPTPETFADYDRRNPFLHMVDGDDCYNIAFSDRSDSMVHPTMLIQFRTPVSADLEQHFDRVLFMYNQKDMGKT